MNEQTRKAALRFWNKRVMNPRSSCYGDIALGALETLAHFHPKDGFTELRLALIEEIGRRIARRRDRGARTARKKPVKRRRSTRRGSGERKSPRRA
jgi:hypothetical protein